MTRNRQSGGAGSSSSGRAAIARTRVRELYEGGSARSQAFRYALLALDMVTLLYIVASSFWEAGTVVRVADPVLGVVFLADFLARLWIDRRPLAMLCNPLGLAEAAAILSFLAPALGGAAGFLRVLRTVRLLHAYQMLRRLRADLPLFRRHEDLVLAILHLLVFLFVTTALVYETQAWRNDKINNYIDALYFTVTALTTTGFGDITLEGTGGHLLAVLVMIFGVGLFLRLAQVLFRPLKVRYECEHCGLNRHDADAVHCKHCGNLIHLETEGEG